MLLAGRRAGKTTGLAMLATLRALEGRRVLELAPTADQTEAFWSAVVSAFDAPIAAGACYKNETNRVIELPSGGRIRAKTAWNADTARGDYGDVIIHDEYSLMSPDVWGKITAPMTLDTDAEVVFAFTPFGRNHAWRLYQEAIADPARWEVWHFTSHDNPYLSRPALAAITRDMSQRSISQEIMAQFVEDGAGVFRNVRALSVLTTEPPVKPTLNERGEIMIAGADYVIGVDWGRTNDETVASVWDIGTRREVRLDHYTGVPFALQYERVTALAGEYNDALVVAEANAQQDAHVEALAGRGVRVMPFITTNATKVYGVDQLAAAMERGHVTLQADEAGILQMEAFEASRTAGGIMVRYSAPDGMHDDIPMARVIAYSALAEAGPVILNSE